VTATLPKGFLISTDNCDEDHYYLIGPDGIISHGEDVDDLFAFGLADLPAGVDQGVTDG
jgi:hypothetical protein